MGVSFDTAIWKPFREASELVIQDSKHVGKNASRTLVMMADLVINDCP